MGQDTLTMKWNILRKYGAEPCLGYPESVTVRYDAHLFGTAIVESFENDSYIKQWLPSHSQLWVLTSDLLQYLILLIACELHVMLID